MIERTDQPPPAIHLEITCRPDGGRADIGGEYRVVIGEFADQAGQILRMNGAVRGGRLGQVIEASARFLLLLECGIEKFSIRFFLQLWQERIERFSDFAHNAKV